MEEYPYRLTNSVKIDLIYTETYALIDSAKSSTSEIFSRFQGEFLIQIFNIPMVFTVSLSASLTKLVFQNCQ